MLGSHFSTYLPGPLAELGLPFLVGGQDASVDAAGIPNSAPMLVGTYCGGFWILAAYVVRTALRGFVFVVLGIHGKCKSIFNYTDQQ